MTRAFNPVSAALAFRIWQYAQPIGWDCTVAEIAAELREPVQRVNRICSHRGWNLKLRQPSLRGIDYTGSRHGYRYGFGELQSAALSRYRRLAEEPSE
jgi:hypothetical protein